MDTGNQLAWLSKRVADKRLSDISEKWTLQGRGQLLDVVKSEVGIYKTLGLVWGIIETLCLAESSPEVALYRILYRLGFSQLGFDLRWRIQYKKDSSDKIDCDKKRIKKY